MRELLEELRQERDRERAWLFHQRESPGHLDKITRVNLFFFASRGQHGLFEGQHVGQEELVLLLGAQEPVLDEKHKDFGHGGEVAGRDAEKARVEGRHDVAEENFHLLGLEQAHILYEFGQLGQMELPDVDLLVLEPLEGLLDKDFEMALVLKKFHHVDDHFRVDRVKLLL